MGSYMKKKKVKQALERAKRLEQHKPMSREEVVGIYKEGISFGEKLKNFLRPSWFVKDIHAKKTVKKKRTKTVKKTRKKKIRTKKKR